MEHLASYGLPLQEKKCAPVTFESFRKTESSFELSQRKAVHGADVDIDSTHLACASLDGQYNIRVEIINDFFAGERSADALGEVSLPLETPFKKPRLSVHYCSSPFPSSSQTSHRESACCTGPADASDEMRHFQFPYTVEAPDQLKEPECSKEEDEYLDDSLLDFTDEESPCSPLNFTEEEIQEILADEATDTGTSFESVSVCRLRGHDDAAGHSQEPQPDISVQTLASSQAKSSASSCSLLNEFKNEACATSNSVYITVDCMESLLVGSNCELSSPVEHIPEPEFDFDINELLALSPTDSFVKVDEKSLLDVGEHLILKKLSDEQKIEISCPLVLQQIPDQLQPDPLKCSVSSISLPSETLDAFGWSDGAKPLELVALEHESLHPVHTVDPAECLLSEMGEEKNMDCDELSPLLWSSLSNVGSISTEICHTFPESGASVSPVFASQPVSLENEILGSVELKDIFGKGLSPVDMEKEKISILPLELEEKGPSAVIMENKVLATASQDNEKPHGLLQKEEETPFHTKSEKTSDAVDKVAGTPGVLEKSENALPVAKPRKTLATPAKAEKILATPAKAAKPASAPAKVKPSAVSSKVTKPLSVGTKAGKSPAASIKVKNSPASTAVIKKSASPAKTRKTPASTNKMKLSDGTAEVRESKGIAAKAAKSPTVCIKEEKTSDASVMDKSQAALHNEEFQNMVSEDFGNAPEVVAKKLGKVVPVPKTDSWKDVMVDFSLARQVTIPVEQLERRKRIYMQCVVNHVQNPEGTRQGAMGELLHLMDQVANVEYRNQGRHHWQHPSDLTTRNYSQFVRKSSSTYSLRQWASRNGGYHRRFQNISDNFQRSAVPPTTPL